MTSCDAEFVYRLFVGNSAIANQGDQSLLDLKGSLNSEA
jgi:hypothetical protein